MGYYWHEIGCLNLFIPLNFGIKSSFGCYFVIGIKKPKHSQLFLSLFGGTLFFFKLIEKKKTLLVYYFTVMLVKFISLNCRVVIIGKCIFWRFFGKF